MRWLVGILLVGAAVLKAIELVNEPAAVVVRPWEVWVLPIQVGTELAIGVFALSGLYWRKLRWPLILVFICFAGRSLYLAAIGANSCGCFGVLQIHPWWSFLLDLAVVLGLIVPIVSGRRQLNIESSDARFNSSSARSFRRIAVTAVVAILLMLIVFLARYTDRHTALAARAAGSPVDLVILEPERWIGRKLPVAESIDIDLSKGKWIVLLHRHDCPVCRDMLPRYENLASAGQRVALVEVPPYGDFGPRVSACRYGQLRNDRTWFVETPLEFELKDGLVTAAKGHGD